MCNLYTLTPGLSDLSAIFQRVLGIPLELSAGHDTLSNQPWATTVYPKYQGLFARPLDAANPAAGLEPVVGRWGVVPFFHKGPAKAWKFPTNNARSEEMATKSSFRDCVKARRCIIPVSAICEWTGPQGTKTKHFITTRTGDPHFLAGLWATHSWEGEETTTRNTATGFFSMVSSMRMAVLITARRVRMTQEAVVWPRCFFRVS